MPDPKIKKILESLLFVSSRPIRPAHLQNLLNLPEAEILAGLLELKEERQGSGVQILENRGEFQMATNPESTEAVKNFLNADLREKLTEATVEVLSIIAYRQPISKAELEAIRGVNSQYSIRHLLMRGLVEKTLNPRDQRSPLYQTTTEFLQHMGIGSVSELPEFPEMNLQARLPETPALKNQAEQEAGENSQTESGANSSSPGDEGRA